MNLFDIVNKITINGFTHNNSRKIIINAIKNDNIAFTFNDGIKHIGLKTFLNDFKIVNSCQALGYVESDSGGNCCEDLSFSDIIERTSRQRHNNHILVLSIFLPIVPKGY
jgi:hypothetical protein